jgi:predicted transport protein
MSDIKLFRIGSSGASEIPAQSAALEKSLQTLIEKNLEPLLGVRFLASEHGTGKLHGGRIDTLGIDEDHSPVIIEYKRALNENVINQGLFYLDWLMDHKAELEQLVQKQLGSKESVDWSNPRVLCIANDFTRYDEHAVKQMGRSIELLRYRQYGQDLLLFEMVHAPNAQTGVTSGSTAAKPPGHGGSDYLDRLQKATPAIRDRFESLRAFLLALGDDVQMKTQKFYLAFKRIKNFACVEIGTDKLTVYVKVSPDSVPSASGFLRDVRTIGHYGTGDLEITVRTTDDLERAKPLIVKSYEAN